MVSKEELRKLSKEKLVDLIYDLLNRVDKLTARVQDLRGELQRDYLKSTQQKEIKIKND